MDDCVEVFVDRDGDGEGYAHLIVSVAGIRYDKLMGVGVRWNPEYSVATVRGTESWTAELEIPFAAFGGPPQPGETWRMNFCRERQPVKELGAWSVPFGGFHSPRRFGFVQFK